MSIKLKDTIYDLINRAEKDGAGNTITSTYLKLSGGMLTGDLGIKIGDTDKFVVFDYDGDWTAGASWRIGVKGSGSSNTNYFSLQSGTSTTSITTWTDIFNIGQNDFVVYFNQTPKVNNTAVSLEGHTHNYAGSSSPGGAATSALTSTKLTTARTLWGQSFNGTANVSGNMTGVGSISMSGALTLTGTDSTTAAINFSRASYNYIHAPASGLICIQPNGMGATSAAGYHFNGTEFFPAANDTYTLGTSSKKWKNVYATTFTGSLSGNATSSGYTTYIRITSTNPTSATTYNPIWAVNSSATSDGTDDYTPRANNGFSYITLEGTASALGYGIVRLGNSTASGTAGNKYGMLRLYSESSGYVSIRPGSSSTSNYTLYLPGASGQLVYHTNDTQIGGSAQPVFVTAGGEIGACSIAAGTSTSNRCLMVTNGSNGMYYTPSITGNYLNGALISTVSDTTTVEHTCTNSNGSVSLYAATNRGLYDRTNSAWIIYLTTAADHVYVSKWASKGSTTAPVYFNSSGEPTQGSTYAGGTKVTLNGTAKGATTASFYAPTSAGTSGQYLIANSSGIPTWHTIDPYDYNKPRTANTVLAAPNGENGSATFRKLVAEDLPSHSHGAFGGSWYTEITVDGDADTYYPVIISSVSSKYPMQLVNISRGYAETAPNSWNTSTHRGGLTLTLLWNGSRYWDGNGSGSPCHCVYKYESYCTMVGGLGNSTAGIVVWLRGGGAVYYLHSMNGGSATASVKLSTYTDGAGQSFAPKTSVDSISVGWPYALNADKVDNNHSSAFAAASHNHSADNITSGTLAVARGGTGKTTLQDACNALINALSTGSSAPVDADYFVSQYAGGGTTYTTFHRRPVSALYSYMKDKMDSVYAPKDHSHTITHAGTYWKMNDSSTNPYLQLVQGSTWYIQGYNGYLYLGAGSANSVKINSSGGCDVKSLYINGEQITFTT